MYVSTRRIHTRQRPIPMMIKNRFKSVLAGMAILCAMSACEVTNPLEGVELSLDIEDAEVDLGSSGVSVAVTDGQTETSTISVENDLDVEGVELDELKLEPSFFTFTDGAAGKSASLLDTGTITILVAIGLPPSGPLYPLPPVTVTIEDNVVTDVQPSSISLLGTTYDADAIRELIEALPPGERPNMAALGDLTLDQAKTAIEDALENATGFLLSIVVQSDGISGTLTLNQFSIDARVTQ